MRPGAGAAYRKSRRSVATYRYAANILQHLLAAARILAKTFRRLGVDTNMITAVACQLMTFAHNSPHQIGLALRYPTQGEEGDFCLCFAKDVERAWGVALAPPRQVFPAVPVDY